MLALAATHSIKRWKETVEIVSLDMITSSQISNSLRYYLEESVFGSSFLSASVKHSPFEVRLLSRVVSITRMRESQHCSCEVLRLRRPVCVCVCVCVNFSHAFCLRLAFSLLRKDMSELHIVSDTVTLSRK